MAPMDYEVRLALLLHDIGKPHCYTEGDIRHYHGHPTVSKDMTFKILNRLGYDEVFVNKICYLVEYHDMPISLKQVLDNKELLYKRYLVQYCDIYAHNPLKLEKRVKYLKRVKKHFND